MHEDDRKFNDKTSPVISNVNLRNKTVASLTIHFIDDNVDLNPSINYYVLYKIHCLSYFYAFLHRYAFWFNSILHIDKWYFWWKNCFYRKFQLVKLTIASKVTCLKKDLRKLRQIFVKTILFIVKLIETITLVTSLSLSVVSTKILKFFERN